MQLVGTKGPYKHSCFLVGTQVCVTGNGCTVHMVGPMFTYTVGGSQVALAVVGGK